jgi:predicted MFS family arabinose efflux permease
MLMVPHLAWNYWLFANLGLSGFATAFRMAPLLAIMTELVDPSERGTFLALRNTLSQFSIAGFTLLASTCYFYGGYSVVSLMTAVLILFSTLVIFLFVTEPNH